MAYHQGIFQPRNPKKYKGDPRKICYRSSWEFMFMMKCDNDPAILEWSSEEIIIPYVSPLDNRWHRYFVDFMIKTVKGTTLIEIKPFKQTIPPKPKAAGDKVKKKFIREVTTYMVNDAKWKAAEHFCDMRGWKFLKLTEKDLPVIGKI